MEFDKLNPYITVSPRLPLIIGQQVGRLLPMTALSWDTSSRSRHSLGEWPAFHLHFAPINLPPWVAN